MSLLDPIDQNIANSSANNSDMCSGGYIKAYRSMRSWRWHDDAGTLSLWMHLLWMANYEDRQWHDIVVKRGQVVTSVSTLCEETGLSKSAVNTRLDRLVSTGEIKIQSGNKYSVITICNYDTYQASDDQQSETDEKQIGSKSEANEKQIGNESETNHKQIGTLKEEKERKEIYKEKKKEIFSPPSASEVQAYLDERGIADINAEGFVSFYESKGWMIGKNKMKDWKAAIRTWNLKNKEHGKDTEKRRGTNANASSFQEYTSTF